METLSKMAEPATERSEKLFELAQTHLVGGVNSPVRAFKAVGGTPRFIRKAKGAMVEDVDGNTYVDFVGSWGPMILGHNAEPVMKAVKAQLENGTSYGAPCELEIELAGLIKEAMPSIDLIRFTSSGTEATMSALRLARAYTKRALAGVRRLRRHYVRFSLQRGRAGFPSEKYLGASL